MKKLEERQWLRFAKMLGEGEGDKIIHVGCGQRPSMFIKNEPEGWWAYCHRCRGTGRVSKTHQRIKKTAPPKTGWVPKQKVELMDAIVKEPLDFRDALRRYGLGPYVTLLHYSEDTGRIYFPDDSGNNLGLDATGTANARWYSPSGCMLLYNKGGRHAHFLVTNSVPDYLDACRKGSPAALPMNRKGQEAALAEVVRRKAKGHTIKITGYLPKQFIRNIEAL